MEVGSLSSVASANLAALKKAIKTEESLIGQIINGMQGNGLQSQKDLQIEARKEASKSLGVGNSLDISA